MAQMVQNLPGMKETQILSLGWEDSPREKNGNLLQYSFFFFFYSNILDWRIPWTEEAGELTVHGITKSWT